jgi:hypothetical protein
MNSIQVETVLDSVLLGLGVLLGAMGWSLIVITVSIFLA